MHITAKEHIAGYSSLIVRSIMRWDGNFSVEQVAKEIGGSNRSAKKLLDALCKLGYLTVIGSGRFTSWVNTNAGNRLALATAAPQLTRAKAETVLHAVVQRAKAMESDATWAFRIREMALFGSMMSDSPMVSDIDLLLDLTPRFQDADSQQQCEQAFIEGAWRAGKRFSNVFDQLLWPRMAIYKHLKNRTRAVSFSGDDWASLEQLKPYRIVYRPGQP